MPKEYYDYFDTLKMMKRLESSAIFIPKHPKPRTKPNKKKMGGRKKHG